MRDKTRLPFIDKIVLWLNCFFCFALLISYLAPVVDPRKAWLIAFFGLAYPLLVVGCIIFIVYWLFRKPWYASVSLITIALGWGILKNNVAFHSSSNDPLKPKDNGTIRMMTYNVHNFKRYGAKNDTSTKKEILQIINAQQPDIIGFQEFYSRNHGQYDMLDSLVKIMGSAYYYFKPIFFNRTEAIGIAIFSKYPIIRMGTIPISDTKSENACLYIDVKKDNKEFRVYSVHLQSIRFDPEDYKYLSEVSAQGKTDMSSTRRLGSKLKIAFIKRSIQVDKIKKHAAQCPYPYIISGDFNDTPTSYTVNQMSKGLKNAFREKGFGFGRTYNGDFPNYQIDYIMVSPQFDVDNYTVIEKRLSDHYPVRSDLILSDRP
ncbi:endonuclease/exonuclease/phosphatase family metal-dependent hydrolase [Mucilaginibacter frigoritolerans]|uniref:Endonuclease/exonuclease/phosphatase family metal-dependent hydrolase n=1 Tax=Mucilaginibacter frigoritolerans TaxID=652788 RepID=A0A562U227_9SPHI|nr:endonuclease/exonuclease/phosphatase family protein [Mucilaginibacter frigoritolerans]TWI99384.1 endonuclease/exonuclease/phosphatase family metal-dependent hydrolase [Mucilaginibacter frigoritolerans]